jgi:pimeloyl-ACP methyl ester carboxylesterase/DNA-binding CsgD family transcriptional regulator
MNKANQHIRFCTSPDGVRIAFATSGAGPPLVKAANWLTHIEFDWKSPVWRHWIAELSRNRTYIRYDERGCGLSDWDVADLTFESWVGDLEAVVDAAGLEKFALLGVSQGGPVAIAFAARHPERVTHLVLYGTFARGRFLWATPPEIEAEEMLIRLAELGWDGETPAFLDTFATMFFPDGTHEQRRSFTEMMRLSTSPGNAVRLLREWSKLDVRALAPQVRCPTLVLHPRGDARIPFEEGRLVAGLIPGARFVPLDSRNHILPEGEPAWDRFVEEVRAFLPEAVEPGALPKPFSQLSAREKEILELIAKGLDNPQIAHDLFLSEKTVRNHITSIFAKLDVPNRAKAIVRAREAGFGRTVEKSPR